MGIAFIVCSFLYSLVAFLTTLLLYSEFFGANKLTDFLLPAVKPVFAFFSSDRSILAMIVILALCIAFVVLMFIVFANRKSKPVAKISFASSLISVIVMSGILVLTLTQKALLVSADSFVHSVFGTLCIMNFALLLIQFGLSVANGLKFNSEYDSDI